MSAGKDTTFEHIDRILAAVDVFRESIHSSEHKWHWDKLRVYANALFAANDLMALGALEAIAAAGKSGKIAVVGFDALDEARAAVKKGTMAGTVAQDPAQMGRVGVEWAARVLKGETAPAEISVPIQFVK